MTDQRVWVKIIRHSSVKLVGLISRAVVDDDLAAWINPLTQQAEILSDGTWQLEAS